MRPAPCSPFPRVSVRNFENTFERPQPWSTLVSSPWWRITWKESKLSSKRRASRPNSLLCSRTAACLLSSRRPRCLSSWWNGDLPAGVIAANIIAGNLGFTDVVSFDMGGTTAKAGLILDGRPKITKEYEVGADARPGAGQSRGRSYPIRTPVIALVEIGAGGGSIAWVDPGEVLRV